MMLKQTNGDAPMNLSAKVAVITGAGSGIGRRVALALGREGYALVLAGRRREALAATAIDLQESGFPTLVVSTDVSKAASVKALFAKTRKAFGRVDLLFNNAGVFGPTVLLEEVTPAQWRQVIDTNLTGAFLCTQEAFRMMRRQRPRGGRIINNGSLSAHSPRPNSAPYTATKHAITGLTKASSLDGRKYNIACGQIDIGNASTDMTRGMKIGVKQANGSRQIEPTIDVEHVARAIVYMASLPLDTNVQFLTVMATQMPFIGRG
jgi:NAD(P)-dependent dehydrogenase (short-subunit alcohol dehydrogenase family)